MKLRSSVRRRYAEVVDFKEYEARIQKLIDTLLEQSGLTESLAGRFFLHRCIHWSWPECRDAFHWDMDRWIYYGGYPGAAAVAETRTPGNAT